MEADAAGLGVWHFIYLFFFSPSSSLDSALLSSLFFQVNAQKNAGMQGKSTMRKGRRGWQNQTLAFKKLCRGSRVVFFCNGGLPCFVA
jgi:hypothetical protein